MTANNVRRRHVFFLSGFDPKGVISDATSRHLGLQGMRERGSMLGGTLSVQSRRGGGTIKTLRIPIKFAKP